MSNSADSGNRPNSGPRKRGPNTPEGKLRSSMNAFKTGKYSRSTFVLRHEDKAAFEQLVRALVARIQPVDVVEYNLVRQLASVEWRLHRILLMDTAVTDREFEVGSAALDQATAGPGESSPDPLNPPLKLGIVTQKLLAHSRLPQYLASRESQLIYAKFSILQQLDHFRKGYPLAGSYGQLTEPMDLKLGASFQNEFETNSPPDAEDRERQRAGDPIEEEAA